MDLKIWQKENRWNVKQMAKELGVNESTLSSVRTKNYKPTLLLAKAIVRFTDGEVTLSDLGVEEK